ncbi:DNA cytosine methyltransferase [Nonomuraea ferruginea]
MFSGGTQQHLFTNHTAPVHTYGAGRAGLRQQTLRLASRRSHDLLRLARRTTDQQLSYRCANEEDSPPIRYPLRAIDLFCGAGGLTEGFKLAYFEVTFALDKDKDSCETYQLNHPEVRVECGSITDYSPAEIAAMAGGRVDVVIGGPSCQGFSTAGRRSGWVRPEDERNSLWEHMLAVVSELKPRAFLMENVPGMVYWKAGHFGAKKS